MYNKEFCNIYKDYGWDYFSLTMGQAILDLFKNNSIVIKKHLDLGCGVGTLCDFFYNKGIETKGIDISPDMIKLCKIKNNDIDFFISDMTEYLSDEKYDLITITCDAINHILEEEKLEKLFSHANKMLNKNGYFIFDILNKDKLLLNSDLISNRDNNIKVHYYITKNNDLVNTNVRVMQNQLLVYEFNVLEKLYDVNLIKRLLDKKNFKLIKAEDKILNEKQRFEDKLYFICKKR